MVTALGIDVRRAFTIVFALGGALAALAGVLSGVYFGAVDPARGTSLLIFAFIVVVIGGLRLDRRLGDRGRRRRADPAVRELLRLERDRRPRGRPPARRGAARPARRPRPEGGALRRFAGSASRSSCSSCSPLVPKLSLDIPVLLQRAARQPRDAPAARALPPLRGHRADLRPPVRLHGPPLVRARALRRRSVST